MILKTQPQDSPESLTNNDILVFQQRFGLTQIEFANAIAYHNMALTKLRKQIIQTKNLQGEENFGNQLVNPSLAILLRLYLLYPHLLEVGAKNPTALSHNLCEEDLFESIKPVVESTSLERSFLNTKTDGEKYDYIMEVLQRRNPTISNLIKEYLEWRRAQAHQAPQRFIPKKHLAILYGGLSPIKNGSNLRLKIHSIVTEKTPYGFFDLLYCSFREMQSRKVNPFEKTSWTTPCPLNFKKA